MERLMQPFDKAQDKQCLKQPLSLPRRSLAGCRADIVPADIVTAVEAPAASSSRLLPPSRAYDSFLYWEVRYLAERTLPLFCV
jgi:hypothetical protein